MIKMLFNSLPTVLTILSAIVCVLFINIVCFAINESLNSKSQPDDDEPDVIPDVSKETGPRLDLPHAKFNPTLSAKPIPLPHVAESIMHRSKKITTLIAIKSIFNRVPIYDATEFTSDKLFFYTPQSIYRVSRNSNNLIETALKEDISPLKQERQNVLWLNIHNAILKSVVNAVKDAIENKASMIEVIYEYDGVWAYAAGYWPTSDYPEAQAYVEQLSELSQKIDINFVKLTKTNQHHYQDLIDRINNKGLYYA